LPGYVLGIQPSSPGYAAWTVAPHPGDLSWAEGQVPTPHGTLAVKWGQRGGVFTLAVTAPAGTSGTVVIPSAAAKHAVVTVNGRVTWRNGSSAGPGAAVAVVVAGHAGPVAAAG
ncbi:MAG TPA: alpha-L-rhamnosidase C-terminal domain-containing protein, partial [Streptosporangiaceae bacterium]|nr:alpha-L-rhamnosidase C-terminal domain-containing protein [Streptosporangiaceae bacterium]